MKMRSYYVVRIYKNSSYQGRRDDCDYIAGPFTSFVDAQSFRENEGRHDKENTLVATVDTDVKTV